MDRLAQSARQSIPIHASAAVTEPAWISQNLKEHLTVISEGQIRDALPEDTKQAPDLLIVRGPETSDHWVGRVAETAIRKGLTVHVLGKPADGISMSAIDEYKNNFVSSGKSHTWLLGHGARDGDNHEINIDGNTGDFTTLEIGRAHV